MTTIPPIFFRHLRLLGSLSILLSLVTWGVDLADLVYHCPYCRVQRSVIGLLGILMLLPNPHHWLARYWAAVFGILGLVVAATQHFNGWKKVFAGTFELGANWYVNSFILSGFAILIIVGQLKLIHEGPQAEAAPAEPASA